MRAIRITGPQHMEVVDAPTPTVAEGQVLVRAERLSICGSDMRTYRHVAPEEEYPLAPGVPCHEIVGVVEESRGADVTPGQRVVALPPSQATTGGTYGGGTEYVVTDADRVIPVPEGMDPTTAVMCQPVGTVLFACQRLGSVMGKRVVVLGQGAIGLTFTHILASAGAKEVVGIDLLDERLRKATEQGATATVNPTHEDVVGAVAELTGGRGADVVVEAAGTEEAVDLLSSLVRPHGTLVLFGLPERDRFPIDYVKLVRRQATILPTVNAAGDDPAHAVHEAVDLVSRGRLDVSWLVTHRLPMAEAPRAYSMYEGRLDGVIKVVMEV